MIVLPLFLQQSCITLEAMKDLRKTEEVITLLHHLPYIAYKPYSVLPDGLLAGSFIDLLYIAEDLREGTRYLENEVLLSEECVDQFESKILPYCINLIHSGRLLNDEVPDVITENALIYWMQCPPQLQKAASPQPAFLIHLLEDESTKSNETKENETSEFDEDNEKDN
jgi:hypothetical protein